MKCLFCAMEWTVSPEMENKVRCCPFCGKETPKGKFCMERGAALENKCPNCGAEVPAGAKFCLECGQKL